MEFIKRFDNKPLRTAREIMNGEVTDPVRYDFEDAFLIIKVVQNDNKITLSDSTQSIK